MSDQAANQTMRWLYHSRSAKGVIISMAVLSLLAGVLQVLVLKWQNRTIVTQCDLIHGFDSQGTTFTNCKPRHFTQAFLQTLFMFGGECFALLYWYLAERRSGVLASDSSQSDPVAVPTEKEDAEGSLWWWITPAPLDFLECALGCVAVTITYASTVQMLHNFMVIASAIFTMMIIRIPLRLHEWAGCMVVTAALILASVPAIHKPESATESHQNMHWLGILLAIVSTCIHSLQNIWEEALFRKKPVTPSLAVGIEGVFGFIIALAALPVVEITGYESPQQGWHQMMITPKLRTGMLLFAAASLLNNVAGVAVTKQATGLLRCLFMSVRAPMVWICEMLMGWNTFDWFNFASMFVLAIGLAIYMMTFPFSKLGDRMVNILSLPMTCGIVHEQDSAIGQVEFSGEKTHATPATATPAII